MVKIMDSKKYLVFVACAISLAFTQCKKKVTAPVVYKDENSYQTFLQQSGLNQSVQVSNNMAGNMYIDGYSFKPLKKGVIKAVVVKIPEANSNLVVSLWDIATANAIKTEVINVSAANTETTKSIDPITLLAGKEYIISMHTKQDFIRTKSPYSAVDYPITVGNITVTRGWFNQSNFNEMPTIQLDNILYGDISFIFQQQD
jgi:Domain of unknown function (DUF4082)